MEAQTPEFDLLPYQEAGRDWLSGNKHCLLGDEMGVGKSAQAIAAADKVGARNVLVICPAIARINWAREFDRFSQWKRSTRVLLAGEPPSLDTELVITSFDLLLNDVVFGSLFGRQWDAIIVDEAHYLKEPTAERTKRVVGKHGLIHKARHFWPLSGTFAPNHVGEMWLWFFLFGYTTLQREAFVRRYCQVIDTPYGMKITGNKQANLAEFKAMLSNIMLRRTKDEVMFDLPELTLSEVTVPAGPVDIDIWFYPEWMASGDEGVLKMLDAQQKKLQQSWDSVLGIRTPDISREAILPAISPTVTTLRRYVGLQKVPAILEMVREELENGLDKIVLFAVHRDVIVGLQEGLKKYKALSLYGGTPPEKRQKHIDKFQRDPKTRVFIGNIQACGVAISLTAANEAIFVESDWVPANNAQAVMRLHRKGQTRPVRARFASLEGSLDFDIQRVLRRKTKALLEAFD